MTPKLNRWKRFADWDERPLRLDKFAAEDPANGFSAFSSPADPKPGIGINGGRVVSLDGVLEHDYDMIDRFIARHHIDPEVAPEAMALESATIARWLVDMNVPREKLVRLAHGMTPAKLAEVVSQLNALEIAFAYSKMRARKTPGNQAHVTNGKDDPLQLAADAATAVAFGFDEIETTMRVSRNAWSNAVACAVGGAVGRWGTLFQCSSEEAEELRIAMAGFTSYAETVSVYGTEKSFTDGDDTPWSKAFLAAAYASRGVKMRCTSGAGSELLMGFHEAKSLLYLEARCLCLQRGMGVQGTQNGGIDGAPLTATIPGGVRELMAENLIAVWLDLECASGNDARSTESEIRVGAKILPYLIAGSDLICSGMGSILKYDNSFNPSLINGEELEDYMVLQRDFEADGGLTPLPESRAIELRERAVAAIAAVFEELGLSTPTEDMKTSVVYASGSDDTRSLMPRDVSFISEAIKERGITVIDAVKALANRGFREEAENLLNVVKLRLSGDYLQTSAMIRNGRIVSAVNDPNDYLGPGSGYRVSEERRLQLNDIRDVLDQKEVLRSEALHEKDEARRVRYRNLGPAANGSATDDLVIGISPAFGLKLYRTTAGHRLSEVLGAMLDAIRARGLKARVVRFRHTADTSFLGLSAARLAGSGIGIGIQAKGTAVIHQRDRQPHNNLELFSNAPITRLEHYRALGANAAAYALGEMPEPIVVPQRGEAMGSRYHARVALIYAIETGLTEAGAAPEEVDVVLTGAQ
ncbi:propanediol/glycerol family dehydratase large subunit [Mesorhizobium sp. M2A.F.Ca.ET.037.01.1.1]|uniref:propanediol/glycerol family dehydratase large subunit n=1 Tax=unclassified Mesorhizobium TaxID=325217 RepID=UPI000F763FFA|nr:MULTISPECIES: propanediol/glycerol family dehydratase large subunit [unclassified Mesorhizobium]RUY00844.1 propanediol/glycerol family dehydratase large subunit [Mesorhizobium sp. M2A.F.Ca.ET.040.01.1.1]RVC71012.1 propanediol/glycerol family dehydratase large subunit [Mesorhizobium sp. M00.F.Ca.ET.038.03.1.1]AZO34660.1 propanediol/glycerol family dehydratase large subunit [Mesorhizobium sp. M2A.F.Ca.ET.046.03.2.1]RUX22149.1 propanediol/glycerol family dehydratase large subunit [Mesorhizobium